MRFEEVFEFDVPSVKFSMKKKRKEELYIKWMSLISSNK
jgi:hypothetical protein